VMLGREHSCPGISSAWTVFWAVVRAELLQSFYSRRLGFGFVCASVCQLALVYLQRSSSTNSPLAMSFFFVPNALVISALVSFVCLGSVMDEREGKLFALEVVSPASRVGLATGKMGYSTIIAGAFCVPMFVTLPASRSLYGYYSLSTIVLGLGIALFVVLCYAWGAVALASVMGRRNLCTTVLSLWFAVTAWFARTPFDEVPRIVSVTVPADLVRVSVFKLFWETTAYSSIAGIDITHRAVYPLLILVGAAVLTVASHLLISRKCDVY
jgi:hypothetical protein